MGQVMRSAACSSSPCLSGSRYSGSNASSGAVDFCSGDDFRAAGCGLRVRTKNPEIDIIDGETMSFEELWNLAERKNRVGLSVYS